MATDQFKTTLFALILFSLFAFLMVYSAVQLGVIYGISSDEIGGGALNESAYQSSIDTVADKSEGYRERFESGKIDNVDTVTGVFTIVTDIISLIITPFKLMGEVMKNLLHIPDIVISVILGLLSLSLIFAIWGLLRKGD